MISKFNIKPSLDTTYLLGLASSSGSAGISEHAIETSQQKIPRLSKCGNSFLSDNLVGVVSEFNLQGMDTRASVSLTSAWPKSTCQPLIRFLTSNVSHHFLANRHFTSAKKEVNKKIDAKLVFHLKRGHRIK